MRKEYKFFTIKLPPELHSFLKNYCYTRKITMTDFALNAFKTSLDSKNFSEEEKTVITMLNDIRG